ncbi:MAG: ASPIC/UnbV domain-containing protein, partial [Planctomycetota bacterium]
DINRRSYLHLQELNGSFSEQGVAAGFTTTHTIRGVAVADYDRDGWSDAAHWSWFGANPGIQLYSNQSAAQNTDSHFLTLQLEGDPTLPGAFRSTRDAIGARAYVTADFDGNGTIEADETRLEEVLSGHSNASTTSSLALEFGLGDATTADVRVVWGSGRETLLSGVVADQFLTIVEQAGDADFDQDSDVDGQDFLAWQRGFGTAQPAHSDGDTDLDGDVDGADLAIWQSLYGGTTAASTANDDSPAPAQVDSSVLALVENSSTEANSSEDFPYPTMAVTQLRIATISSDLGDGPQALAGNFAPESNSAIDELFTKLGDNTFDSALVSEFDSKST